MKARNAWFFVSMSALVLATGCAKKAEPKENEQAQPPPPAAPASPPPTATNAAIAAPNPPIPNGPVGRAILSLEDKMQAEKADRPTDTVKAEDVFAALQKAGIPLNDVKQGVGSVYGAKYCASAKSGEMAFGVCEYATPELAAKGREDSLKALQVVPNREIKINKKTTLTVRQPPTKTPETEALAKKGFDAFAKL